MKSIASIPFIKGIFKPNLQRFYDPYFDNYKTKNALNKIIPNLFDNLEFSVNLFIEAIQNKDLNFLKNITIPPLYELIKKDIQTMKQQSITFEKIPNSTPRHSQNYQIHTYVIYGQDFENRLKDPSMNRYTKFGHNYFHQKENSNFFKDIYNKHIYGFQYFYFPSVRYEFKLQNGKPMTFKQSKNSVKKAVPKTRFSNFMLLDFETDSQRQQFYIVDVQNFLKKNEKFYSV